MPDHPVAGPPTNAPPDPHQEELWARVNAIKRRVIEATSKRLSFTFRSTHAYQMYTAMCGECQIAYEDRELDETHLTQLEACAARVIELYREMKGKQ